MTNDTSTEATEPGEATDAVCQHCGHAVEWARVNGWGTFVHTATGDQDCPSAAPILYRGERYLVTVTERCLDLGDERGVTLYGLGAIAVRAASAPSWAPNVVSMEPEGGNGVYLCIGGAPLWGGAFEIVAAWLTREGYRDESGRITDTGRAALYASEV